MLADIKKATTARVDLSKTQSTTWGSVARDE
jgi:hypothetical protein